jgi:NTE family protein/lysophospholipid hydrolase
MKEYIQAAAAFAGVSTAGVDLLATAGTWVSLTPGETLFHIHDKSRTLYLIAEGRLDVLAPGAAETETVVGQLGPGDVAGEIQMLTGGRRSATLRANTAAKTIRFSRETFERLAETEAAFLEHIRTLALTRLRRNHLALILPTQFGPLDFHQMEEIERLGRWVTLHKGDVLFHQGDTGDGAYILVTGLLGVLLQKPDRSSRLVNHIQHGEVVGEMALLSDEPRSATIYATRESDLLFFGKGEFAALIEKHPGFLLGITRLNIDRLRHSMSQARPRNDTSVTALVAASPSVPMAEFASHLTQFLSGYCRVLHADRKRLQAILGAPDDSAAAREILVNTRFPAWLCSEEGQHRIVLLETDCNDPHWTEACIRQADQVLTVGLAGESPALSEIEARCVYCPQDAGEAQKRLVLIHPDECNRPRGTARWLENRNVEMHHHVRLGNGDDFKRLARFLTGSAICLALGGGGARGFAHIGALRALREEGTSIDMVGGTSMGAVIGAELALGLSPEEMLERNRTLFSNAGLVRDLTLPLLSFTTGKAYAGTLKQLFGEIEIEDLWTPYFCVSSNISRAERAIHRTGLLWRKVRASSGVQGMFPPVVLDGELHVDGALFSNLPADVMKTVCEGKVIAIDVSPPVDLLQNSDYGDVVSGWKILWKKWFPGSEGFRCADLGTILQRAGEAVSMANQKLTIERMADYYLRMPVEQIGLFAFAALPMLEQIGYEHAKMKITEWKADGRWLRA